MVNNTSESKKRTKWAWFFDYSPVEVSYFLNGRPHFQIGRPLIFVAELANGQFPRALLWCMMWPCLEIVQNNVNSAHGIARMSVWAGMMPTAKSIAAWKILCRAGLAEELLSGTG